MVDETRARTEVLFVLAVPFLGPVWTVCKHIIENLDRANFGVHVAVEKSADGELDLHAEDVSVTHWRLLPARRPSDVGVVADVARLVRHARRQRIAVVHGNEDAASAAIALAVARACGASLVLHHHTIPAIYSPARVRLMKLFARAADLNVGVSRFVADEIVRLGIPRARVTHVPNSVDAFRFHPGIDGSAMRRAYAIPPAGSLVVQVARVWREKRQEDLVRALALARRRQPDLHGLAVGWEDPRYVGPYASYGEELRRLADDLGVGDAFVLSPPRPDTPAVYSAADIVVLPSVREPFGLVIIEAMASGKAVIGTRSGGIPEIIEHGITGLLVPPQSPEALAEAIITLARDAPLRERIGRAARDAVVTRFSPERIAAVFGGLYRALSRGGPAS